MDYAKPAVIAVKPALETIELVFLDKLESHFPDRIPILVVLTAGAYEADE